MSDTIAIFVSVKQQVDDISKTLAGLLFKLRSLRKTVDSQHAEICSLNRNIDKLLKENREMRKRLEKYEKPPKDSDNSSTPPSKEPIKAEIERRTKSLRKKSDKPVGGQMGHEGTTRKMVDTHDEIDEVSSQYCRAWGRDLSEIEGVLDYVTQEIDMPPLCRFIASADSIVRSVHADAATVIMLLVAGVVTPLPSVKTSVPSRHI